MFFYFKWFVVNISETTVYFTVLYKIVAVAGKGALVYCKLSSVISKLAEQSRVRYCWIILVTFATVLQITGVILNNNLWTVCEDFNILPFPWMLISWFSLRYQEFDSLLQKINNIIVLLAHTDAYNFPQTHHLSHLLTDRVEGTPIS